MLRNIATTYLARFALLLSTFVLVPIVASAVGLQAYGLYALVASMGIIFAQDLGMGSATTRFAAEAFAQGDSPRLRRVAAASTWYFIVVSLVVCGGLTVAFAFVVPTIDTPTGVDSLALTALAVGNVLLGVALSSHRQLLAGVGRLDLVNIVQIGQALVRIIVTTGVVLWMPNVVAVAAVDLAITAISGVLTWMLRRRLASATISDFTMFRWGVFRELFRFSLDLLVMSLAAVVILQSGTVLAALFLPLGAVAVYTAANRAFLLVREAANSLTLALLPTATMHEASGVAGANSRLFLNGTRLANSAMILLLLPLLVFTQQFLTWWVGPELAGGYQATQVLVLSMLANNNHLVAIPILTGKGQVRPYSVLHAVWAISGIALAPVLAPSLGVVGIALAFSVPIVILEPIYISFALHRLGVGTHEFLSRAIALPYGLAVLPATVFIVAVGAMPSGFWTTIAACAAWVLVMSMVYLRFAFTHEEREYVRNRVRRRR